MFLDNNNNKKVSRNVVELDMVTIMTIVERSLQMIGSVEFTETFALK